MLVGGQSCAHLCGTHLRAVGNRPISQKSGLAINGTGAWVGGRGFPSQ